MGDSVVGAYSGGFPCVGKLERLEGDVVTVMGEN